MKRNGRIADDMLVLAYGAEAGTQACELIGSSLDDLREFPEEVQDEVGFALCEGELAAAGSTSLAKPLRGFKGAGVLEIVGES